MPGVRICPECEADLRDKDPVKHAVAHWSVTPDKIGQLTNEEAKRRYRILTGVEEEE